MGNEFEQAKFDEWMKKIDADVKRLSGLSVYDLPDCPFADWFEEGRSVARCAARAIKMANED